MYCYVTCYGCGLVLGSGCGSSGVWVGGGGGVRLVVFYRGESKIMMRNMVCLSF